MRLEPNCDDDLYHKHTHTRTHWREHCTQNSQTYAIPIHEIVRRLLSIDRNANAENFIHLPIDLNWLL